MSDSPVAGAWKKPVVLAVGGALLAVAVGLDIWLAADSVPGNTWSELFRKGAYATPVVPWVCGVLMGHWFHPTDDFKAVLGQPNSIALLLWLTWLLFIVGLAFAGADLAVSPWIPVLPALIAGWLLWPV